MTNTERESTGKQFFQTAGGIVSPMEPNSRSLSFPLHDAQDIVQRYIRRLMPHCERIAASGDVRRKCEHVQDIDIVCIPKIKPDGLFVHPQHCIEFRSELAGIGTIMFGSSIDSYTRRRLKEGPILHLYMTKRENWGFVLALTTGPQSFIQNTLAKAWHENGYRQSGDSLQMNGTSINTLEESDFFRLLSVPYIEPHERK